MIRRKLLRRLYDRDIKAAFLEKLGRPLAIRTAPDPELRPGEVIVDVAARAGPRHECKSCRSTAFQRIDFERIIQAANQAITHAAETAGPFKLTVICP